MRSAFFSLAELRRGAGEDAAIVVRGNVEDHAMLKVSLDVVNVAGVKTPKLTVNEDSRQHAGPMQALEMRVIGRGGHQAKNAQQEFRSALETLVDIASLQTSVAILDQAIKLTNRRVNALHNVVIPRLQATAAYVVSELDEADRQELFRLKLIQNKKRREREEEEAAVECNREAVEAKSGGDFLPEVGSIIHQLLQAQGLDPADLLF
eukprot:tig00021181_g19318.t1